MWEMLIRVAVGLSGWVFAGWIVYCRWKDSQKMIAILDEMTQRLDRSQKTLAGFKEEKQRLERSLNRKDK